MQLVQGIKCHAFKLISLLIFFTQVRNSRVTLGSILDNNYVAYLATNIICGPDIDKFGLA